MKVSGPTEVLPGGSIYYKCDDETQVPSIGGESMLKVDCVKEGGVPVFKKPTGWDITRCVPASYPNFASTHCNCLGDDGISVRQARDILDVCRQAYPWQIYANKINPTKQRCGVTDLENIKLENVCACYDKNNRGAGTYVRS